MKRATWCAFVAAACWPGEDALADGKSRAAAEAAEAVMARFGARAGRSAETLAARIESYAARHGDDAIKAVRQVGPEAFALMDRAGAQGAKAAGLMARHGEAAAARVLSRPKAMSQFARYGEEAAEVLVKHPGVAEGVIEKGGQSAVRALGAVEARSGRRIAMALEGELAQTGKHPELLDVIGRYGERAAQFVWDNKGALAVGTVLAAFLANPEPFLDGTVKLASVAAESTVKPFAENVARSVNWNLLAVIGAGLAGLWVLAAVAAKLRAKPS